MIYIRAGRRGLMRTLSVTGHADYKRGDDIVCAACSALGCALGEHLQKRRFARCKMEKGRLYIEALFPGSAYKMTLLGLGEIAKEYPGNATVVSDI